MNGFPPPAALTSLTPIEAAALPPAVLAYLGDAVYELLIREALLARGPASPHVLHRQATALVCAPAQARMARALAGEFTAEEAAVFRRGRNAHCGVAPAAATAVEYRLATGLESLMGFLYLAGRRERLADLLAKGLRSLEEGRD